MKQDKPAAINLATYLKEQMLKIIGIIRDANKNIPARWLADADDFIQRIAKAPPEECLGCMALAFKVLCFIFRTDNPFGGAWGFERSDLDKPRFAYYWRTLFDLAREENYEKIKDLCNDHGELRLSLGYLMLYLSPAIKIDRYLEANPNARNSLWVHFGEIIESYPQGATLLKESLELLSQLARQEYTNKAGKEPETGGEPKDYNKKRYSDVQIAVKYAFSDLSDEQSIVKAAKGDKEISYVPHKVAMDLIDEYRKYEERKGLPWDKIQSIEEEPPKDFQSIESVPDISKLHEVEKASDLSKWIETLEDPIDREIARLKYIEVPKITVRELAERLDIPRSTIYDRLRKLKPTS